MVEEKKYFMAGTDEEVLLGDVISQTLEKDFKDGRKITREVKFKLTEEAIPYALDMGIIEEAEDEEEDELIDFGDEDCPFKGVINEVVKDQEELEKRVDDLEEKIKTQDETVNKMMKDLKDCLEQIRKVIKEEKTASPKKK